MPKAAEDRADAIAERNCLVRAECDQQRAELRQTWVGPPAGLQAAFYAIDDGAATEAMIDAARETIWRQLLCSRSGLLPITDNLAAFRALVVADLSR